MILFKRFCFNRPFVCFLTVAFSILSFASSAPAMFIPSPYGAGGTNHREADFEKIQKFLESKLVQHKLSQLGLSREQIEERLHQLDNEQIHQIASQIDSLEAGGSSAAAWIIAGLLLLIIVFLVLELTGVIDVLKW